MGFQVRVRGEMQVAPDRFAGWKRGKVNPSKFTDWAEHGYAARDETPSVGKLLERFAQWNDPADHDYLRLEVAGAKVSIEGILQEQSFNDIAGLVGALWRSAARFGGVGELSFTGEGIDLEDRILINGTSSRFVTKHKKSKINAKTTPIQAQEAVWLRVMNDQMTAARRVVGEYMAAGGAIVPELAFEFLSAFDDAMDKAGPVIDAITAAIEGELSKNEQRVWRSVRIEEGGLNAFKNDFLNKLMWLMNGTGRERQCRELFEHWRDGGGAVTLSNYGRYFYSLIALQAKAPVPRALEEFEALWEPMKGNAHASGEAGAIFSNAASAAAMIGDRDRTLDLLKTAIAFKYSPERIAADDDFKAYREDPAFLELLKIKA